MLKRIDFPLDIEENIEAVIHENIQNQGYKSLKKGVSIFNAPYSNTRSVVELAIAEIIMLMRNLPDKIRAMHDGVWQRPKQ